MSSRDKRQREEEDVGADYFSIRRVARAQGVARFVPPAPPPAHVYRTLSEAQSCIQDEDTFVDECVERDWPHWAWLLREGRHVVLYGHGSTGRVMEQVAEAVAPEGVLFLVEGHRVRPLDLVRDLIRPLLSRVLPTPLPARASPEVHLDALRQVQQESTSEEVFVLVQAVDGPAFSLAQVELLLALGEVPRVHIFASVLHEARSQLLLPPHPNWVWWQLSTYARARDEVLLGEAQGAEQRVRGSLGVAATVELLRTLSDKQRRLWALVARGGTGGLSEAALERAAAESLVALRGSEVRELVRELLDHALLLRRQDQYSTPLDEGTKGQVLATLGLG